MRRGWGVARLLDGPRLAQIAKPYLITAALNRQSDRAVLPPALCAVQPPIDTEQSPQIGLGDPARLGYAGRDHAGYLRPEIRL